MLVSVHLPKTGGSSFRRSVLEPAYGNRLLLDYEDRPLSHPASGRNRRAKTFQPSDELVARYDCVHGHFLATKYLCEKTPCEFAAWFRDPVQRVVSRFFYGKRKGRGEVSEDMTLEEFCELSKFHNLYAKYLWEFDIEQFDFVGITEYYASSVELFLRRFGLQRYTDVISHANPSKAVGTPYVIDPQVRELIVRTNQEDMDIYERAQSRFCRLRKKWL